jgi:hypothetical protein
MRHEIVGIAEVNFRCQSVGSSEIILVEIGHFDQAFKTRLWLEPLVGSDEKVKPRGLDSRNRTGRIRERIKIVEC